MKIAVAGDVPAWLWYDTETGQVERIEINNEDENYRWREAFEPSQEWRDLLPAEAQEIFDKLEQVEHFPKPVLTG